MNKELYELSYVMKKQHEHRIFTVVMFIAVFSIGISLILSFVLFPVRQRSVSMQPDISTDSCVLFTPVYPNPSRGDVVLLKPLSYDRTPFIIRGFERLCAFFTAQQYFPSSSGELMGPYPQIRRIVGLPGDTIYMRDYVLYVRPQGQKHFLTEFELVKKSYDVLINTAPISWDNQIGVSGNFEQVTLGENQYYVLGDNRNSSLDSRLWGAVSGSRIQAKALFEYFPFADMRLF